MEIRIERYKAHGKYTLARVYEPYSTKLFVLDMVEPPLSGFAESNEMRTIDPGVYKLFLKPDTEGCDLVAVLQKALRRPRFCMLSPGKPIELEQPDFRSPNKIAQAVMWLGKLNDKQLDDNPAAFNNFMIRVIIAKQQHDPIYLRVENKLK